MSNIFVIPDIHGQADKLTKIIETNIHPHINTKITFSVTQAVLIT